MKNVTLNFFAAIFTILGACSCATYQIPIESLKLQFTGIDSSKFVKIVYTNRKGDEYVYSINPIKILKCLDNDNNPLIINTGPNLLMIVTDKNNNKTKLRFDRVFVTNTYLYGQALFLSEVIRAIPLKDIAKIQIQDERRKFKYGNVEVLNH